MKETLLMKVDPKTLDNLMNELTSAIIQMKDVEPVQNTRFKDEECVYVFKQSCCRPFGTWN